MKNVILYATDTMADWEYGYLVAGLTMAEQATPGRYRLVVASDGSAAHVTTMGGLRLRPDVQVSELNPDNVGVLILPGADTWDSDHIAVLRFAEDLLQVGTPVAAICGATLGLARSGLLNDRPHTSNAPEFLLGAPGYNGAEHYQSKKTVSDGSLITAPATAPIEFAKAVFERLELFPQPIIDAWYGLYTTGDKKYFDRLIGKSK
ncbi:type 1 glutamine amidotransferase family protein [Alpinimonas psychrophila]|uniref:Putative intracellular protease/amidase n=1 Tax=Alpinimonas psychrophila TaxID=748908 RepID=A0A7W3JUZ1_9MICO|nr:DJ-1/PfpI family protein [Alpinimonas psychrophila]MBA8829731.1 putative intracellular protease/amidase [Alpinimonas psychrophila]